ncbi:MAG TPA: hypothetical protein VKB81_09970 [Nitrospira sp.]|nr:hypothetical protein [Nitrospira sp.]
MFKLRRWHMGEFNKMCIALVFVCLPLGCAEPLQETQQIRCASPDGQILYFGPYDEEIWNGYLVQLDDFSRANFFPKGTCSKVLA